jgi:hypothetical protein
MVISCDSDSRVSSPTTAIIITLHSNLSARFRVTEIKTEQLQEAFS